MALTAAGFELYITVVDNNANTSTLRYDLTAADYAEALAASATILAALDDLTNAVIKGYNISSKWNESALVLPAEGVQVENRASIVAQLSSSPVKRATFHIPAPVSSIFMGTSGEPSKIVDVTNADLATYAGLFHPSNLCTISDGETIANTTNAGLIRGKRTHRANTYG